MTIAKLTSPEFPRSEYRANLEDRIQCELSAAAYPTLRHIGCIVRDGVLILSGRVPTFYLKQVAQTVARRHLEPTTVIDNQISVDRQYTERISDVRTRSRAGVQPAAHS